MFEAIIALGSNLENPANQIQKAMDELQKLPEISEFTPSPLYISTPVGYSDQPDFVNAVAKVKTSLDAPNLLLALQKIENEAGRVRSFRNAPRTLDLDLIDHNHSVYNTETLTLPHPRAHERSFVMLPLADIAPNFIIGTHGSASSLAQKLGNEGIRPYQAIHSNDGK